MISANSLAYCVMMRFSCVQNGLNDGRIEEANWWHLGNKSIEWQFKNFMPLTLKAFGYFCMNILLRILKPTRLLRDFLRL